MEHFPQTGFGGAFCEGIARRSQIDVPGSVPHALAIRVQGMYINNLSMKEKLGN